MLRPGAPAPGEAAMQPCSALLRAELRPERKRSGLYEPSGPPFESSEEPSSAMRAVVSETCVRGKPLQRRKALKLSGG